MSSNELMDVDVTCKMESFSKIFRLKLVGYSLAKNFRNEFHIELGILDLAGHSWAIKFYPNGSSSKIRDGSSDYISFICELLGEISISLNVEYEICLVDHNGKASVAKKGNQMVWEKGRDIGFPAYMKRTEFESSEYLKDDGFTVQCALRLVKSSYIDATKKQVVVPSSDLHQHYHKLLESQNGTDVTFDINGETFNAHKIVLASRSLVFKAHFFGAMKTEAKCMKIEDVKPEVFKLMLHFIYTDNLPNDVEISSEMAQHLLVIADRYGLERLKLISAEILCESLGVETSATTLVLAEQHNCPQLKEVYIDFVSSREVLNAVMASDGFKHLTESCPMILTELLQKVDNSRKY